MVQSVGGTEFIRLKRQRVEEGRGHREKCGMVATLFALALILSDALLRVLAGSAYRRSSSYPHGGVNQELADYFRIADNLPAVLQE